MWHWNDQVAAMAIEERHREADHARLVRDSRRAATALLRPERSAAATASEQSHGRSGLTERAVSPLAAAGDR